MNSPSLFVIIAACASLSSCQHQRKDAENSAAILHQLNAMAADEISREREGDQPPAGFSTWPAFWRNRLLALQLTPANPRQGSRDARHPADANMAFIRQKRAEAGLPAVD